MEKILEIKNLTLNYYTSAGKMKAVEKVSIGFEPAKITAIIGESGSGKSTLVKAILQILPPNAEITPESEILFKDKNLLQLDKEALRRFRWREVSMVFQNAQSGLNPTLTIRDQFVDTYLAHYGGSPKDAIGKAEKLLNLVKLPATTVLSAYPHQLSGGMKQRVIIALALLLDPEFVILDEPTTALDMLTQAFIFDLLEDIHKQMQIPMILITHDISLAAKIAHAIGVMYAGKIIEAGEIEEVFTRSIHPYTRGLIKAMPSLKGDISSYSPIAGDPPDLFHKPSGCLFHPRCKYAKPLCRETQPELIEISTGHLVACHYGGEVFGD